MNHDDRHVTLTLRIDGRLLEAVDDYRFDRRLGARADALRELLWAALASHKATKETTP
jgi:hypothetical protein